MIDTYGEELSLSNTSLNEASSRTGRPVRPLPVGRDDASFAFFVRFRMVRWGRTGRTVQRKVWSPAPTVAGMLGRARENRVSRSEANLERCPE